MRLLLTVHQFLPEHSSGTEILTFHTAKELQARGHEVCVFTGYAAQKEMEDSERFDHYIHEGIKVIRFHYAPIPMGGQNNAVEAEYNNFFFAKYFRQYVTKWKPDIVHFFHLGRLSASPIDVCVDLRIPTVMTPTDFWLICPTNQLRLPDNSLCTGPNFNSVNCLRHLVELYQHPDLNKKLKSFPDWFLALMASSVKQKILLNILAKKFTTKEWFFIYTSTVSSRSEFLRNRMNKIDRVLAPTRLMQNLLQKQGLKSSRISLIPYGIDTTIIKRKEDKGTKAKLRVGFIGTLFEHKGVHLLIEAVHKLLVNIPIELKIYGNEHEFPEYVSFLYQIAEGDPRITFNGTFPNKEIGVILGELDVLVVPSIWYENTPLVIYSAQAAGCPVIATNVGGMSEVVHHEVNGLLFERRNAVDLANCIRRLCEDRTLLAGLAKQSVAPKSIGEYVNELEDVYKVLHTLKYSKT